MVLTRINQRSVSYLSKDFLYPLRNFFIAASEQLGHFLNNKITQTPQGAGRKLHNHLSPPYGHLYFLR
jgi:hypothetical protein